MEKVLLLFSPTKVLEDERVRRAALRIPEVTIPIRVAQNFLDRFSASEVDLVNLAGSDNDEFQSHPLIKPLVLVLIQWGMYQRLISRTSHAYDWILGETGDHGVMNLVLERSTFSEFLWQSPAVDGTAGTVQGSLPKPLATDSKYQIFGRFWAEEEGPAYREIGQESEDRWSLVENCISRLGAQRVVTVGPATDFSEGLLKQRRIMEFDLVESVELDPQLHWFWAEARRPQVL